MQVTTLTYAEGKTYESQGEDAIDTQILEPFPYEGPRQRICYQMNEFSAVCPFSGLPDYGTVVVKYIPRSTLVELKSLKYYYQSFRNVGIFQEAVTARIFKDLWKLMQPESLMVKTIYNTRGGIDTTCVIRSKDQKIP